MHASNTKLLTLTTKNQEWNGYRRRPCRCHKKGPLDGLKSRLNPQNRPLYSILSYLVGLLIPQSVRE